MIIAVVVVVVGFTVIVVGFTVVSRPPAHLERLRQSRLLARETNRTSPVLLSTEEPIGKVFSVYPPLQCSQSSL